jgi:type IV secretion system protein VirB6
MIELLFQNVDQIILALVQGSFGTLTPIVQILWRLMFIIFIAVFGYKVIVSGRFMASDLLVNCLKIIVLLIVATQWDTFFQLVYQMTTDFPSDITAQIMQGTFGTLSASAPTDAPSTYTALSQFHDRALAVSAKLLEGAGWSKWGLYIYALAVWIGTIAFTGYAAMLIVLAKFAVALILAVGPLFILLLIFANTQNSGAATIVNMP